MRAIIFNDTRKGGHPGCMLVMGQLIEGCRLAGINVTHSLRIDWDFYNTYKMANTTLRLGNHKW